MTDFINFYNNQSSMISGFKFGFSWRERGWDCVTCERAALPERDRAWMVEANPFLKREARRWFILRSGVPRGEGAG
jgi:hypothetical protein